MAIGWVEWRWAPSACLWMKGSLGRPLLQTFCLTYRDVQIGDIVTVGECRPLSKTVRFNVLKVTKAAGTKKQFQKF
ncbi:rCG54396, isoform CRA_d [Rattus norvegicus]|uniref:Small ribosomal subunit protein uS17 n=1 Tax=Rattus norvegicus TaxID=10116 RepID=A6JAX3_RAT|nr:rCG54396, isoform CRA_d [Rattus norvegicus]